MEKRYLTIREAATYTGWSIHTLYRWSSQGRVPVLRKNGRLRFDRFVLDEWMHDDVVTRDPDKPEPRIKG